MAKVVVFTKEIIRGFVIQNFMAGGKEIQKTELWENDVVNDFRFVSGNEVKAISGRVSNVTFAAKSSKATNKFSANVAVASVDIDCSENYVSDIYTIPNACILEYGANGSVDDVMVKPLVKLKLSCILSDQTEKSIEIVEGDKFFDMHMYPSSTQVVHGDFEIKQFLYTISAKKFDINGFTVAHGSESYDVSIAQIKSFGKAGVVVTEPANFAAALAAVLAGEEGGVVVPGGVTIPDEFVVDGSAKISGAGIVAKNEIDPSETVLSGQITTAAGAEISVFGVVLTQQAFVIANDPAKIEFEGCKFIDLHLLGDKVYAVRGQGVGTSNHETELVIKDCYFGDNINNLYNFFELNTKLGGHCEISGNYFTKGCAHHNIINLYELADNAVVDIKNNHFEYSGNAIRVGTVDAPQNVKVNIVNNVYDTTDTTDPEYAGLFFVQPYGTRTTSMAGITITATGNKGPRGTQLYYIYCGSNDTQLDEATSPTIVV